MDKPGINRILSVMTIILLFANVISLVLLWSHKHNDKEKKFPPPAAPAFEFITRALKLDRQQQDTYNKLREEHKVAQDILQDSIRNAKDEFFGFLQQKNIADSILEQYSKKANTFEQQRDIMTFRHFQQVRALCTSSQQQKFDNIIKQVLRNLGGPKQATPGTGEQPAPPQ